MKYLLKLGHNAKKSHEKLKNVDHEVIKSSLEAYNKSILKNKNQIIKANNEDIKNVKRKHLIDRLILNNKRIESIRHSIDQITKFKNPIGKVLQKWSRPNRLNIKKVSTPIGVIGVIYESRPNVTADVAALCLKSGNCGILRGGSEAFNSNKILANLFRSSLRKKNIDSNVIQFIEKKDRKIVDFMLSKMSDYIDVIVPRGGKSLVSRVQTEAKIPVFGHLEGICHVYVNEKADITKAIDVTVNAKMRRTSICGAAETLLIDKSIYKEYLPRILSKLSDMGCEIRGNAQIKDIFPQTENVSESDWATEYLDAIISVKVVKGIDEAISHIKEYGTGHTEAIITEDEKMAEYFFNHVNSSIILLNASTQFADGGEFGFGAEIGISTGKMHARGPIGLEQLTTFKYTVYGNGQTRP